MSEMIRIALGQGQGPDARDVHLRACVDRADGLGDLADADVLYFARDVDADEVIGQLAAYPGCVVCAGAAKDGTLLLAVRLGTGAGFSEELSERVGRMASILHALLTDGIRAADVSVTGRHAVR